MQRRRFKNILTFPDRLAQEAKRWRSEAEKLPPASAERKELERKARLADTAEHIDAWLKSPGLRPPR